MSRAQGEHQGGGAWLIVSDAAADLGVSARTIERRIRARKLRSRLRDGRREVFIEGARIEPPEVEVTVGGAAPSEASYDARVGARETARKRRDDGAFDGDGSPSTDSVTDTRTDTVSVSETVSVPVSEHVSEARRRTDSPTDSLTDTDTDSGGVSDRLTDTVSELSERGEHFQLATLAATRQLVTMCDERLAVADADIRCARRRAGTAWFVAVALAVVGVGVLVWATARTTGQGAEIERLSGSLADRDGEVGDLREQLVANDESYEALRRELVETELDSRAAAAQADARQRLVEVLVAERTRLAEALDRTTAERERITERLAELVEQDRTPPPVVFDLWGVFGSGPIAPAGGDGGE